MNFRMIIYLLGVILLLVSALLLLPMLAALVFEESVLPFAITVFIGLLIALPIVRLKPKDTRIYSKEGFITVASAWILLSLFGALPFVISGAVPNYIDAFFETVSGFTTTGATIIESFEGISKSVHLWRTLTHWIGGMGVLVFMLAVLPSDGGQAIYLMRAEVPGTDKGKLVPKMRQSALILYGIYVALTLLEVIALLISGLSFYDSVVVSLSTAGTGGFAVFGNSILGYANPAAEWIIAVFMFIFGINFNMYFLLLLGSFKQVFKNEELRTYTAISLCSVIVLCLNNHALYDSISECIRASFFQVSSIMSTTGFVTANYMEWGTLSQALLLALMFIGACAGSTAGGFKISRFLIAVRSAFREVRHVRRPNSVNTVRLEGKVVKEESVRAVGSYMCIYVIILALSTLLISIFDSFGFETNFSVALSTLNNVGPALGTVGAFGNMASYSYFSKIILSFNMLFGRLEMIPMLILFSPRTWKRG